MRGPGRCRGAACSDGAHCPMSASELPLILCCTRLAWRKQATILAPSFPPCRLGQQGTPSCRWLHEELSGPPALPTSQACGALPSWALPSELEPNLGQRPALPACRPPCSTPCVAARLKRPGQPRTLSRPAAARPERPGEPYAALSRRCLPASLRCTYDFRLAMGASSSSDITHATPSDTKYACAGAATLSHGTDTQNAETLIIACGSTALKM